MICDQCEEQMAVGPWGETKTLVGYMSPPGHNHDDNCVKREYVCNNGHTKIISIRQRCPTCDWVGKDYCGCCGGQKVDQWPEDE